MGRKLLLFALVLVVAIAADSSSNKQDDVLKDYKQVVSKLKEIMPTLKNGGEEALNNLITLRRIMKLVYDDLVEKKNELPQGFSGIANLEETMNKVDSLIEAYKTIHSSSSESSSTKSSSTKSSSTKSAAPKSAAPKSAAPQKAAASGENECTEGPCCNVATMTFRAAGTGCIIDDPCQEPAALCTGDSATCATTDKPDGTNCGESKACYSGKCVRSKDADKTEKEAMVIAQKEQELRKKKAVHMIEKAKHKRLLREQKNKAVKHMLKRFAVMSWLNKKLNSWEADIEVSDYVRGMDNAPSAEKIFAHQYSGPANAAFDRIGDINTENIVDEDSYEESSDSSTMLRSNLNSTLTTSTTAIGVALGIIGIVLIVCYFMFVKKKSPDADVIY